MIYPASRMPHRDATARCPDATIETWTIRCMDRLAERLLETNRGLRLDRCP